MFSEHIPRNIRLKESEIFTSVSARYYLGSRREVDVSSVFKMVNRQKA